MKTLHQYQTKCGMFINAVDRQMAEIIAESFGLELI